MFPFATLHNLDIGERCGSPHLTRKLFEERGTCHEVHRHCTLPSVFASRVWR